MFISVDAFDLSSRASRLREALTRNYEGESLPSGFYDELQQYVQLLMKTTPMGAVSRANSLASTVNSSSSHRGILVVERTKLHPPVEARLVTQLLRQRGTIGCPVLEKAAIKRLAMHFAAVSIGAASAEN